MTAPAIEIQDLEKYYGETTALAGVSLAIAPGEMFGLIGPDGAGKTTLIRILTSLMDPDRGQCRLQQIDVTEDPARIRRIIGYMPQRFSLYPDLTVGENLRFFADLFQVPRAERQQRTSELLDFSRLSPFVKRRAGRLSGGMKQKLALACALVHTPEVLILDEPTTGVDPVSRREFWDILGRLQQGGTTILVSTPYMDEAEKCDRAALMHKGEVLATGPAAEITAGFPGTVFAVVSRDLPALADWLKKQVGAEQVRILGDRVRLSLFGEEPRLAMDDLMNRARGDGVIMETAEPVAPELEDTFVAMIAATEERHAAFTAP